MAISTALSAASAHTMFPHARAVIFDLDGTLIDSAQTIQKTLNGIRADRGFPALTTGHVRAHISKGAERLVELCLDQAAGDNADDLAEFRARYLTVSQGPEILYDQVAATIESLAVSGWRLGLCTNKPRRLTEAVLTQTGLHCLFSVVIAGDDGYPAKPDPASLIACCRTLSVDPSEAVFVGDSEVDAETAAASSCPFVLVEHGYPVGDLSAIPRHVSIATLAALLPVLSRPDRSEPAQGARAI